MDDLELVRGLRSDLPRVAPADLRQARTALLGEMQSTGTARPRLSVRWMGWRIAAGGALAAALVVAVFTAQSVPAPPDRGGSVPGAVGGSAALSGPALILRDASLAAQHEQILPALPDQYVFFESIEVDHGERFDCDGKADQSHCAAIPDPRVREMRRMWLSVDGTHDGLLRQRPQSSRAKWNETPLVRCPEGVTMRGADGKVITPTCDRTPAYRKDLPTDPASMLAYLRQKADQHDKTGDDDKTYAFTVAGDLIRDGYLPPAALAALFQASAQVPGITVAHDAVDAVGRHGISVGWQSHGVRNEMIFDVKTSAYLGERTIALQDRGGVKKGDIAVQSARLRLAIVDRPGQLP
jgi:hypothetical protein